MKTSSKVLNPKVHHVLSYCLSKERVDSESFKLWLQLTIILINWQIILSINQIKVIVLFFLTKNTLFHILSNVPQTNMTTEYYENIQCLIY